MVSDSSDGEDYVFVGTALQDEETTAAGQYRKAVADPAATRTAPVWQQEATDEQGRRRFHGAFTGGFSAGYYNTVGSKEGFTPATFRSSRSERHKSTTQSVNDFLDEDERAEQGVLQVTTQQAYDTFGLTSANAARQALAEDISGRPQVIPGAPIQELVEQVSDSWGVKMLQRMGWRQGRGVGVASGNKPMEAGSRWGAAPVIGLENTPIFQLKPKVDLYGLGFDPYKDAEDFRALKRKGGGGDSGSGLPSTKRRRGVAFGTGVLEEFDTYGEEEDYVTELDSKADAYQEIFSEEDEPGFGLMRDSAARLEGQDPLKQIGTAAHAAKALSSLIRGFIMDSGAASQSTYFRPPTVPRMFAPFHKFAGPLFKTMPAPAPRGPKASAPPPPPPADPEIKRAAETLASFVARNGKMFEDMAKERQAANPQFVFLFGGAGAAYYQWQVESRRAASPCAPAGAAAPAPSASGRPAVRPSDRSKILGEEVLPARPAAPTPSAAPAAPASRAAAVRSGVAPGDRAVLREALGSKFTASSQGAAQGSGPGTGQTGLPAGLASSFSRRFSSGGAVEEGPLLSGGIIQASALAKAVQSASGSGTGEAADPNQRAGVRITEDWWPEPLLCKRFGVQDPHKGKQRPSENAGSRFMTDHLTLPETAAADADAHAAQTDVAGGRDQAPAGTKSPSHRAEPDEDFAGVASRTDAAAMADAFLSSLGLGQSDGSRSTPVAEEGSAATPVAATIAPPATEAEVLGKPMDIFKAIFEADSSDEEGEERAERPPEAAQPASHPPEQEPSNRKTAPVAPTPPPKPPLAQLPKPNRLGDALLTAQDRVSEMASRPTVERPAGPPAQRQATCSAPEVLPQQAAPTGADVMRILSALKDVKKAKSKKSKSRHKHKSSDRHKTAKQRKKQKSSSHRKSSRSKSQKNKKHRSRDADTGGSRPHRARSDDNGHGDASSSDATSSSGSDAEH
eukprot:jgi/Tetstr1/458224/TSEL_044712.t1